MDLLRGPQEMLKASEHLMPCICLPSWCLLTAITYPGDGDLEPHNSGCQIWVSVFIQ